MRESDRVLCSYLGWGNNKVKSRWFPRSLHESSFSKANDLLVHQLSCWNWWAGGLGETTHKDFTRWGRVLENNPNEPVRFHYDEIEYESAKGTPGINYSYDYIPTLMSYLNGIFYKEEPR